MNETISGLSFIAATKRVLSKYAVFRGRATRSEYWWFVLATVLAGIVVGLVFGLFGQDVSDAATGLLQLALLLPSLAVSVRRLHDIGRSGWWILIGVVPAFVAAVIGVMTVGLAFLVGGGEPAAILAAIGALALPVLLAIAGGIVLLVFSLLPSQPTDNKYGPAPVPASSAGSASA